MEFGRLGLGGPKGGTVSPPFVVAPTMAATERAGGTMAEHDDQIEALQRRVEELEALVTRLEGRVVAAEPAGPATEEEAVGRRHLLGSLGKVAAGALVGGTIATVATAAPAAAAVPVEGDATASLPGVSGRTAIASGTPRAGVDASSTSAFSPALRATAPGAAIEATSNGIGPTIKATYGSTNNATAAAELSGGQASALRGFNSSSSATLIIGNNSLDGTGTFAGGALFASSGGDTVNAQSASAREGATAVRADGFDGASGVDATSDLGTGGLFSGRRSDLHLGADPTLAVRLAQRRHTRGHAVGELVLEAATGDLYLCVVAAPPGQVGTWRKIAGPATAGAFHPIPPTRVYDSRLDPKGKLAPAEGTRVTNVKDGIDLATGVVNAPNVVPAGATAIAYNLTIAETQNAGFLAVYPANEATFKASSINWDRSGQLLANAAIVQISSARQVKVSVGGGGSTHYLIDVTGYYL